MFHKKTIQELINEYQTYQDLAHQMKSYANNIRSKSKKVTALLRRDKMKEAEALIEEVEDELKRAFETARHNLSVLSEGYYKEGIEEYVEAKIYYSFLKGKQTMFPEFLKVKFAEKIGGLADFTGELVRKAMTLASKKNMKKIEAYKDMIEEMASELSRAGFCGKLRSKYDDIERNVKSLERIIYDIKK